MTGTPVSPPIMGRGTSAPHLLPAAPVAVSSAPLPRQNLSTSTTKGFVPTCRNGGLMGFHGWLMGLMGFKGI